MSKLWALASGAFSSVTGFLAGWKIYLAVGLVVAAIIGALYVEVRIARSDLKAALADKAIVESALAQANQVNADNLVELTEIKARHAAELKVLILERDAAAARVQIKTIIRERVIYAASQPNGDGPIAPALRAAVDGLRNAAGARPAGQDPGRETGDPRGAPQPGAGAGGS